MIVTRVVGDLSQPILKWSSRLPGFEFAKRFNERFLHKIFKIRLMRTEPEKTTRYHRLVPAHNLIESIQIAFQRSFHEFLVCRFCDVAHVGSRFAVVSNVQLGLFSRLDERNSLAASPL